MITNVQLCLLYDQMLSQDSQSQDEGFAHSTPIICDESARSFNSQRLDYDNSQPSIFISTSHVDGDCEDDHSAQQIQSPADPLPDFSEDDEDEENEEDDVSVIAYYDDSDHFIWLFYN